MPVLSFYEGISELSFLKLDDLSGSADDSLFKFPYVYSEKLFGSSFTKDEFYSSVYELACKSLGIVAKDTEVFACGVINEPQVPFKTVKKGSVLKSLPPNYAFISDHTFAYSDAIFSMMPVDTVDPQDDMEANLSIYTNVFFAETGDILNKDSMLREIIKNSGVTIDAKEVVFTGERVSDRRISPVVTYLFLLDIVKNPGIYHLKMDRNNLFSHTFLAGGNEPPIPSVGTLINSPGKTECLYETDVGTSQLIDLEAEKLFVLPLEAGAGARLMVKNVEGQTDTLVYGGELGVILDTRDKSKGLIYKDSSADVIDKALHKL